jgi:hypothetical protein
MVALTLGVVVDLMTLIALPIIQANFSDQIVELNVKSTDIDDAPVKIKPLEERLDSRRIQAGVGVLLAYAALSMYLMSPAVKKYMNSRFARAALSTAIMPP